MKEKTLQKIPSILFIGMVLSFLVRSQNGSFTSSSTPAPALCQPKNRGINFKPLNIDNKNVAVLLQSTLDNKRLILEEIQNLDLTPLVNLRGANKIKSYLKFCDKELVELKKRIVHQKLLCEKNFNQFEEKLKKSDQSCRLPVTLQNNYGTINLETSISDLKDLIFNQCFESFDETLCLYEKTLSKLRKELALSARDINYEEVINLAKHHQTLVHSQLEKQLSINQKILDKQTSLEKALLN